MSVTVSKGVCVCVSVCACLYRQSPDFQSNTLHLCLDERGKKITFWDNWTCEGEIRHRSMEKQELHHCFAALWRQLIFHDLTAIHIKQPKACKISLFAWLHSCPTIPGAKCQRSTTALSWTRGRGIEAVFGFFCCCCFSFFTVLKWNWNIISLHNCNDDIWWAVKFDLFPVKCK